MLGVHSSRAPRGRRVGACSDGGRPRPDLLPEPRPRHVLNSSPQGPRARSRGRSPGGSTKGGGDRGIPLRAQRGAEPVKGDGPSGLPKE
jgi:hypothetical protein